MAFYHLTLPLTEAANSALGLLPFIVPSLSLPVPVLARISVIVSLRDIPSGEELFVDYSYNPLYDWSREGHSPTSALPAWYHPVAKE